MDCYKKHRLINFERRHIFYMKKFLQMLYGFIPKKGIGFEKYLVVFCMLIGVQGYTFAQPGVPDPGIPAGSSTARLCDPGVSSLTVTGGEKLSLNSQDYVYYVVKGESVTLSVSSFGWPTTVKWEKKTTKEGEWIFVESKPSDEPLEVNDLQADVLYRATFDNGMLGGSDQRALLVTGKLVSDISTACPNTPIQLDVDGAEFAYRSEWWLGRGDNKLEKVKEYADGTMSYTETATDAPLNTKVILKYDEYNCSRSTQSPRFESNIVKVDVETDCKEECQTTSTGDYYEGTDFDPSTTPSGKIPDGVQHHFADRDIVFDKGDISDYWIGTDVQTFFGQVPYLDQNITPNTNYYMFCENPNDRIVSLGFPAYKYKNQSYTYKMRLYLQVGEKCDQPISQKWSQAKFIVRTEQGTVTRDCLEIMAYDNSGKPLKGSRNGVIGDSILPVVIEGTDTRVLFPEFMDITNLHTYDVIRIEVTFYGMFPNKNDPPLFVFKPMFEQFGCAKVAVDYISAQVEDVCLTPKIVCVDDTAIANAAGYPRNSKYTWLKETYRGSGQYAVFDESLNGVGNNYEQAHIVVKEVGKINYRLIVEATVDGKPYRREKDFVIAGRNCKAQTPTGIEGSGIFCLPNVLGYKPNIVDDDKEVTYQWYLYDPDGKLLYKSVDNDPHFMPSSSKADSMTISLDENTREGEYKLEVHTFSGSTEQGTPVYLPLSVYRRPQASLVLGGPKYEGLSENDKKVCPSDVRSEMYTVALNGFETTAKSLYTYTWSSDPNGVGVFVPRSHKDTADINVAAIPGLCNGDADSVRFSVIVDVRGCSDTASNAYGLEALGEIEIDCSALVGTQDTFRLESKQEEKEISIPIPPFKSGCDTDPDLIIEMTSKRPEVRDTMGTKTVVVSKSEIEGKSSKLNVTLPWGTYNFHYIVKDGCGRTKDCDVEIVIDKVPVVNCTLIDDIDITNDRITTDGSSKCAVKFGQDKLKVPELVDENDYNETVLIGEYLGRRHFIDKQDKEELKKNYSDLAKFDKSVALEEEYDIDYTYILWKFTNAAGKSAYCVQEVLVRDTVKPNFDCSIIKEFRPETEKGKCEIKFVDFKDDLYKNKYYANDSCPEPVTAILGVLHLDSIKIDEVPDDRIFKVGIADTIYWQFRDRHNNVKYCPQEINAFSSDTVKINCDTISERKGQAEEGTCFANAKDLNIPSPIGIEPCTDDSVPGVGTRNDGKALDDPYPTGNTYITWIFKGKNSYPSTCVTHVFVDGNTHIPLNCDVLFPKKWYEMTDCEPLDVKLETKQVPDPCVAGHMIEGIPFINGEKIELTHEFQIGETFVTWKFWDFTKAVVDSCIQSIHLRDTIPPVVNCDTMKNDSVILHDKCSIPFKDLRDRLGEKIAIEYCTGDTIYGEPYLINDKGERVEFPSEVSVGIYPIQWVFANDSLTTKESVCDKTLFLLHDGAPIFDCRSLPSPLQLWDTTGECKIILNPNVLPIPEAVDSCKRDYIVYGHGYVQLFGEGDFVELCYFDRENNKAVYLMDLPLGGHNVKWIFKSPFSTKEKECEQTVLANSDAIKKVDCSKLADYVHVTMRRQGPGATFEEVRDSGLILPNLDFDVCKVLDTLFTRDDDKSIYTDYYPVGGRVVITWLFKDTTPNAEKEKVCYTTVDVQDGDTPICIPPALTGVYTCLEELPAQYADYAEFRKAGGILISNNVDVSDLVDPSTFRCDTLSLGDKCDFTFKRTYRVKNLRNQESVCKQEFRIRDNVPPVWMDDATSETKVFDCEIENFFPTNLRAKDECSNEIISEYHKVNEFDGIVDGVFYTVNSNRSDDPRDCNYYNYEVVYRYIAVDRCRNRTERLKYVAQVQDTFAPIINMPDTASWLTDTIPAVYGTGCKFYYPDITSTFPIDSIDDVCDPEAVKYFKITQTPAAGTIIENTKGPHYITVHITDPCGLEGTVDKPILVQDTKDIVNIKMVDTTICAELGLSLMDLKETGGHIYSIDLFTGKWAYKDNVSFTYDFYKGEPKFENLKYSNNKYTYGHLYEDNKEARASIIMNSLSKDGFYTIVVMDTVRQCVDTASAYITIHSAPSITLDAAPLLVCEKDSIHLVSDNETLYEKYNLSVNDNGEEITEEGWMLNGNKYKPETLLDYTDALVKMQYYATNKCQTGTSEDWIPLHMRRRMSPDNLMLTTEPNNPSRVYLGESAKLNLVSKYKPELYMWYRVKGTVDGNSDKMFDKYGNVREDYMGSDFEQDTLLGITNYGEPGSKTMELRELGDSAQYYVLLVDSVCPAVPSNIVAIDVVQKLPTAFTPHNSIGMNDIFMEGHKVVIFNRYGQKMVESDNGWDGTCRGDLVDPGVYFYEVIINDGERHKGSIEVVYFK